MNLKFNNSDIETTLSTDIAAMAIWDADALKWVESEEIYFDEFNKVFDDGQSKIENHCLVIETGGDGSYLVKVRLNNGLSTEEEKDIHKKSLGHLLETDGNLRIGSPEWVGYQDDYAVEKNLIDTFSLKPGKYIVDTYSILVKDINNKPKHIRFVFCVFEENKYPNKSARNNSNKSIKIQY